MNPVYISRSTAVAARSFDGEMMIMSALDSTLYTLNPVGTLIWQSADGTTPLTEIIEQKVCAAFNVDATEAVRDAECFVCDLAAHGILLLSDKPMDSVEVSQKGVL